MHHPRPRRPVASVLLAALVSLSACTDGPGPADSEAGASGASSGDADDHGEVAGAVELDDAPVGLTTIDRTGDVRHLDLVEEEVSKIATVADATAVHTDGRYLLLDVADGVQVVDSGVWTWDHVDHFHYYRAEPRAVGIVEGRGPANVATTMSSTSGGTGVFFRRTGEAVRLDTAALADGEVEEVFRVAGPAHDGMLVPVGDHSLLTVPEDSGPPSRLVALDADGERVAGVSYRCEDPSGTIATRVGTVIGCADGALLATVGNEGDGQEGDTEAGQESEPAGPVSVERVPYPSGTDAPRALAFSGRDGRPTVAGLARSPGANGSQKVWMLDTRERTWGLLRSPEPLVEVTAVDDEDEHVLGLTAGGRVAVLDGADGGLLATSRPLAAATLRRGVGEPALVADQQRAYLSAPAERRLYEIDFVDGARIARSFETPTEPLLTAGTGR